MVEAVSISQKIDQAKLLYGERLGKKYGSWLQRYPLDARPSLLRRLWDDSAWFELLVHELFTQLHCEVDVIDIGDTHKTPDFRISRGNHCYVEATSVNPRDNPFLVDPNLEDALRILKTLKSADFKLRLIVEGKISRPLSKRELTERFGPLLENDPAMVRERIQGMGEWAAPHAEFREEGWGLRGELVPISLDGKTCGDSRELIIGPMGSYGGDASPQVQKALSKKAGKYDHLDAPLVVAANVLDGRFDRDAALAALFGPEQIRYFPNHPESQMS